MRFLWQSGLQFLWTKWVNAIVHVNAIVQVRGSEGTTGLYIRLSNYIKDNDPVRHHT